jgi:hypothetical protein
MKTDVILKTIGCESYSGHIGNLFCEDENNNEGCYYDGGDCCGNFVYKDLCTECICYEYLECLGSIELIGNGFCNDQNNNADCKFDGGDCCGGCVRKDNCSECVCYNEVASPNDLSCKFCIHTKVSLLGVDSLWGMFIPADWLS